VTSGSEIPWLVVNSAFNNRGGQERANFALARELVARRAPLTLVAHEIEPVLEGPSVRTIRIRRPLRSAFLGERALERAALRERARMPECTIFLGNAGNCPGANISWVHFVHAAWPGELERPPLHVRATLHLRKRDALRRERLAVSTARMLIANSERTKGDLVRFLGVEERKIRTVYFGTDALVEQHAQATRSAAEPTLLFVGALGWDRRKGLDIALRALAILSRRTGFRHRLIVAGAGSVEPWREMATRLRVIDRVSFVSFVESVADLMSQADLLISPSRYESYGLAVQEAICAGLPPLVLSDRTGFMERLGTEADAFNVHGEDASHWAERIDTALANLSDLRTRARAVGERIRGRSWAEFARSFIDAVESRGLGTF
jgi:glycosyltransferase involved in cell wall biosynthesis